MATGFFLNSLEELHPAQIRGIVRPMTSMQTGFIAVTFLGPAALYFLSRKVRSPKLAQGISAAFAASLLGTYVLYLRWMHQNEILELPYALPMHLCDWAAIASVIALIRRNAMAFELAYFWGISGTLQALFTPAINMEPGVRTWIFFIIHSAIPASVFWLMFEFGMRPRKGGMWKVLVWSEVYLVCALIVNWMWSDANFGFLHHRPAQKTLLDLFPDPHWLYVLCINATAVVFFLILDLPWYLRERLRGTRDA
jgi:hypothetical integral membrane protein (TIGR02206 family)